MKIRWNLVVVAVIATTLVGGPSSAHHDDDEAQYAGVMSRQNDTFDAVAANAAEHSSAPEGFAPCVNGMAADTYPCDGIDMMSFVPHAELGTTFVNDIWGWTDPQTSRDYALVGASEGTVFVDISDPKRPDVLGILPTQSTAGGIFWRDIKVFSDHAYIVSEHSGHGMQVFDLTQLRDWDGTYTTYAPTTVYTEFGRAHNIAINTETGFAYAVGAREGNGCGFGLHMIDINDPASPTFAGCFADHGYIHDTECVIYEGPDAAHIGKEICFNSNPTATGVGGPHRVSIVDVTDKSAPVPLSAEIYANNGYSHQGWLTPDQQFFLHGDELDEVFHGVNTTTRVWDVRDLDDPELIGVFANDTTSIDHNLYTEGRVATASNYTSGLRVYDTRNVSAGELSELAFFDVYPENDNASFEGGTWSNYPFFRQKKIVAVSSMDRGLFVLRPRIGAVGN
ncbi:MAG: choice-of-anchor B family protein [Actinomycetota bacterium]